MAFAQRFHGNDINTPKALSPSDHFDGKRFFNPTLPTAALRGARILIVEDESILALDLENRLTRESCDVIGLASREAKALKRCGPGMARSFAVLDPVFSVRIGKDECRYACAIPRIYAGLVVLGR